MNMMSDSPEFELVLDPEAYAALAQAIAGDFTDWPGLAGRLGVSRENLALAIVRQVTSPHPPSDVARLLKSFALVPRDLMVAAAALEEPRVPRLLVERCPDLLAEYRMWAGWLNNRANNSTVAQSMAVRSINQVQASPRSPVALDFSSVGRRYEIAEMLGRGGQGIVCRAWDQALQQDVAVKLIETSATENASDHSSEASACQLALREAEAQRRFTHPHILPVLDWGIEGAFVYLVFPLCSDDADRRKLDHGEAVAVVRAVADALEHVHQGGFVHRDVKPHNILFNAAGVPFLSDFGLAASGHELLEPNFGGTLTYMSPEQFAQTRLDARTDVYGLGVVLYKLLARSVPFEIRGKNLSSRLRLRERVLKEPAVPPSNIDPTIPKALDEICLRALAKNPDDRFSSAAEMAQVLENWQRSADAVPKDSDHRFLGPETSAVSSSQSAIDLHAQSLSESVGRGDQSEQAASLVNLAIALSTVQDHAGAVTRYEEAAALYASLGDQNGEASTRWRLSRSLKDAGDTKRAVTQARSALNLFERAGNRQAFVVQRQIELWLTGEEQ